MPNEKHYGLNICYNCKTHFTFSTFRYFFGYIILSEVCKKCGHTNIVWCYKNELDLDWKDDDEI